MNALYYGERRIWKMRIMLALALAILAPEVADAQEQITVRERAIYGCARVVMERMVELIESKP